MAVTVRLFAAVREAAGAGEVEAEPGPLPGLLEELRDRFGETFASRLAVCSILVDGAATSRDAHLEVPDGAEVVLLPPVSGGAVAASARARPARARGSRR